MTRSNYTSLDSDSLSVEWWNSGPGEFAKNLRTLLRSSLSGSQGWSLEEMLVSLSLVSDLGLVERGGENVDLGLSRLASVNSAWLPNQER